MIISKPKLLLHFCCGPCGPEMSDALEREFDIVAYWYNPNIYPEEEYFKRLEAFKIFCSNKKYEILYGDGLNTNSFFERSKKHAESKEKRCRFCYTERMKNAARFAARQEIPFFTTTLLSSFYQDTNFIKSLGERLSDEYNISFVFREFWHSYYQSKNKARELGLYIQKYCGCCGSMSERKKGKK
ncbi:MAG: epoxyqueuosine reductase QueH [bacterium]